MKNTLAPLFKPEVKLITCTPDIEANIAYMARVSNPSATKDMPLEGLIRYLITHNHWSPFEMATLTVSVRAPRDITRQILRHRSNAFQEFSGRYQDMTAQDVPFCVRECRLLHPTNRQMSVTLDPRNPEHQVVMDAWFKAQDEVLELARNKYEEMLSLGVAKEVARCLLPEGLTMSFMYITFNVRSAIHYLRVRNSPQDVQREHVAVAQGICDIITQVCPTIAACI